MPNIKATGALSSGEKPRSRHLALGISGGHHESEAVALDLRTLEFMPSVAGKPFNIHRLHRDKALIRIDELLNALALNCGLSDSTALREASESWMFSLPGAWRKPDKAIAVSIIAGAGWRRDVEYVIDDTLAGLFVETAACQGICAFAGTGASVVTATGFFDYAHVFKVDGWGPVIGDYGSSFQIAANYFRYLRRLLDTGGSCPYFERIRVAWPAWPNIESYDHVQRSFDEMLVGGDPEWPVRFASIAKIITTAADQEADDNGIATKLTHDCADEMGQSIRIARKYLSEVSDIPLVFQGALFRNATKYREQVVKSINGYGLHPVIAREPPVYGALLLALKDQPDLLKRIHGKLKKT